MRIAIIKKEKCHPTKCGGYLCAQVCPVNRAGKDCIVKGDPKKLEKPTISETLCIGCGICTKRCPFEAITIINLPEALKEKPVFRFGVNSFEMFRLPTPQNKQVVGILGANGIGKTTALEILAGLRKPNLGKIDEPPTDKEIIKHFKGTELQAYFQKLFSGKIKISYKPQYIDKIPDQFKGKVIDLLSKLADEQQIKELAEKLRISEILDRKLDKLAGGELQKVAIAAAILKPADLYLFDEPASYLDVKERVRVAKIIRELAEDKAVLVVEHDLLILDYLADLVNILFGQEAVYGVVSHPKSCRTGINAYLSGFLRDENIRFRNQPIKFETGMIEKQKSGDIFTEWPALTKKFDSFSLEIQPSEIFKKEVVGIVGANAIGKTTFAQILAGKLKPDKGELKSKLKISYKSQYIKPSKANVLDTLREINKEVLSQENKISILRPLEIEHLLNRNLDELSGGELQRVAIASCLLREADIYLLDEPSTYLDVEQRLAASRTIQKVIKSREAAALVIDHDLIFISYLSDRLLVFSGKPGKSGSASVIMSVKKGMNSFLKELGITCRKDPETGRPRVNKAGSVKDREQISKGEYYL